MRAAAWAERGTPPPRTHTHTMAAAKACPEAADPEAWKSGLHDQLAVRDTIQASYFRDLIAGYGGAIAGQRSAQQKTRALALEVHSVGDAAQVTIDRLMLENAELQRRCQQSDAENCTLQERFLAAKTGDAETINALNDDLERQTREKEKMAEREQQAAAAQAEAAGTTEPAAAAADEPPPPPLPSTLVEVAGVEISGTITGHDGLSGLECTLYVLHCSAAALPNADDDGAAAQLEGRGPAPPVVPAAQSPAPKSWAKHKRFSEFEELRGQLLALPQLAPVVGGLQFPAKTWAAGTWGLNPWAKLDPETVAARQTGLAEWLTAVLGIESCRQQRVLQQFLQDGEPVASQAKPPASEARWATAAWEYTPPLSQSMAAAAGAKAGASAAADGSGAPTAAADNHYHLRKGENVKVLSEASSEWWYIEGANSACGYVPANYLIIKQVQP